VLMQDPTNGSLNAVCYWISMNIEIIRASVLMLYCWYQIIDGGSITAIRTGIASAVATKVGDGPVYISPCLYTLFVVGSILQIPILVSLPLLEPVFKQEVISKHFCCCISLMRFVSPNNIRFFKSILVFSGTNLQSHTSQCTEISQRDWKDSQSVFKCWGSCGRCGHHCDRVIRHNTYS
jgi:hypothetical protein